MRVCMLARGVILGKFHANFVADALAPEIPVEVILRHAKLPSRQKWPRGAVEGARAVDVSECRVLASGTLPDLLDHANPLRLRAVTAGRARGSRREHTLLVEGEVSLGQLLCSRRCPYFGAGATRA